MAASPQPSRAFSDTLNVSGCPSVKGKPACAKVAVDSQQLRWQFPQRQRPVPGKLNLASSVAYLLLSNQTQACGPHSLICRWSPRALQVPSPVGWGPRVACSHHSPSESLPWFWPSMGWGSAPAAVQGSFSRLWHQSLPAGYGLNTSSLFWWPPLPSPPTPGPSSFPEQAEQSRPHVFDLENQLQAWLVLCCASFLFQPILIFIIFLFFLLGLFHCHFLISRERRLEH